MLPFISFPQKGRTKGKGGKGKVAASKLSSKHLNKLAKQGKLKTEKYKKKLKEKREEVGRKGNEKQFRQKSHTIAEVAELQEEDLEFYGTPKHNSSFIKNIRKRLVQLHF